MLYVLSMCSKYLIYKFKIKNESNNLIFYIYMFYVINIFIIYVINRINCVFINRNPLT